MDGPVRKKVLEEASKNLERASMSPVTAFLKLRPYLVHLHFCEGGKGNCYSQYSKHGLIFLFSGLLRSQNLCGFGWLMIAWVFLFVLFCYRHINP